MDTMPTTFCGNTISKISTSQDTKRQFIYKYHIFFPYDHFPLYFVVFSLISCILFCSVAINCLIVSPRYDPQHNRWTKVSSMNTRRLGVAVAVLGGYLYAVGGSDGQCPLNTGWFCFQILIISSLRYERYKNENT